jgi:cytochrome b pre-mRNA-processing protein 3
MFFKRYRQRRQLESRAADLYLSLVQQARQPAFYTHFGVPDVLEGRLDMIILHAWLLMRRLGTCQDADHAKDLNQSVFDLMFSDMDRNLREMGVMDLAVGKRVCRMAEAFYGRVNAYDKAQSEGPDAMALALQRNLYQKAEAPGDQQLQSMVAYISQQEHALMVQTDDDLMSGRVRFLPVQEAA